MEEELLDWSAVSLRNLQTTPIKRLKGFDRTRGHFIPDRFSPAVDRFLSKAAQEEVTQEWKHVYEQTKQVLGLRRQQILGDPEEGFLECEFFHFSLQVAQSKESPKEAVWSRRWEIRRPDPVLDSLFLVLPDECVAPLGRGFQYDFAVSYFEELQKRNGGELWEDGERFSYSAVNGACVKLEETALVFSAPSMSGVELLRYFTQNLGENSLPAPEERFYR